MTSLYPYVSIYACAVFHYVEEKLALYMEMNLHACLPIHIDIYILLMCIYLQLVCKQMRTIPVLLLNLSKIDLLFTSTFLRLLR